MADITTILSTDTLSASRTTLNANFTACKTSFAGSSAPAAPAVGQMWYDTTNYILSVYDGTYWRVLMPTANQEYGGLLPRSAGQNYPMNGHLYCGQFNLKMMANPVDSTDGATKSYVDDEIDDHVHSGATGQADKVLWSYLKGAGTETGNTLIFLGNDQTTIQAKQYQADGTTSYQTVTGETWTSIASVVATANANERKIVGAGAFIVSATAAPQWRIVYVSGSTTTVAVGPVTESTASNHTLVYFDSIQPAATVQYTWQLQIKFGSPADNAGFYNSFIMVL